jgi:hypothetical protein
MTREAHNLSSRRVDIPYNNHMSAVPRPKPLPPGLANPLPPAHPAHPAHPARPGRPHPHRAQLIAAAAAVVWLAGFVQAVFDWVFDPDHLSR